MFIALITKYVFKHFLKVELSGIRFEGTSNMLPERARSNLLPGNMLLVRATCCPGVNAALHCQHSIKRSL